MSGQLYDPEFDGPSALNVTATPRWKQRGRNRKGSKKVVVTKFTNKSRTRVANLARKVPDQAELRRRAREGWW